MDKQSQKIDISQKILDKIDQRKIKITDRWVFWAKKLGFGSGLALTAVVLIFLINLILYYLQQTGSVIYLSFGLPSLALVLKNLPFNYIILAIILIVIIRLILRRTNLIYQKFYYLIMVVIAIVLIGAGIFLFYSGINNVLANKVAESDKKIFILSEIYQGQLPCFPPDRNGIVGKVIKKNINNVTIQTLDGQKEIIVTGPPNIFDNVYLGQIIGAIGTGGENIFVADKLKTLTPDLIKQCLTNY